LLYFSAPDDFFATTMTFPATPTFNTRHPMQPGLKPCKNCGGGTPMRRL
jgi:hypothetical protein